MPASPMMVVVIAACAVVVVLLAVLAVQASAARKTLKEVNQELMVRSSGVEPEDCNGAAIVRAYSIVADIDAVPRLGSVPYGGLRDSVPLACGGAALSSTVGVYTSENVSWMVLAPSTDASRLWDDVALSRVLYLIISGVLVRVWTHERSVLVVARANSAIPSAMPAGCSVLPMASVPLPSMVGDIGRWNDLKAMLSIPAAGGTGRKVAMHVWAFSGKQR